MLRVSPEKAMSQALSAGVMFFQYRSKTGDRKSVYETSLRLASIARDAGAAFVVNDHADIARAVDADGVHLGQDDLPIEQARKLLGTDRLIGISTHSLAQAREAEQQGADYVGFGPIFPTATKDAGVTQGLETLRIVRKAVGIPIIAIGGISRTTVADVIRSGADGVAVISAVLSASDIQQASEDMLRIIQESGGHS